MDCTGNIGRPVFYLHWYNFNMWGIWRPCHWALSFNCFSLFKTCSSLFSIEFIDYISFYDDTYINFYDLVLNRNHQPMDFYVDFWIYSKTQDASAVNSVTTGLPFSCWTHRRHKTKRLKCTTPSFRTQFQAQGLFVSQRKLINPDELITTSPDFC